jgi:hypothetical protein
MSPRGRSLLALAMGLLLLAGGLVIGLVAHDDDDPAPAGTADANERARYQRLIEQAARLPARFDASIVEIRLAELPFQTEGKDGNPAYQLVENGIAERIAKGKPPLRPDFPSLPHAKFNNRWAVWIREGKVEQKGTSLVALLVRERSPGPVETLRLHGRRLKIDGWRVIFDPTAVFGNFTKAHWQPTDVEWTPEAGTQGALVPLFLMHYLGIVAGKETDEIRNAFLGTDNPVLTGEVISPKKLTFETASGETMTIPIKGALRSPLRLSVGAGS